MRLVRLMRKNDQRKDVSLLTPVTAYFSAELTDEMTGEHQDCSH